MRDRLNEVFGPSKRRPMAGACGCRFLATRGSRSNPRGAEGGSQMNASEQQEHGCGATPADHPSTLDRTPHDRIGLKEVRALFSPLPVSPVGLGAVYINWQRLRCCTPPCARLVEPSNPARTCPGQRTRSSMRR